MDYTQTHDHKQTKKISPENRLVQTNRWSLVQNFQPSMALFRRERFPPPTNSTFSPFSSEGAVVSPVILREMLLRPYGQACNNMLTRRCPMIRREVHPQGRPLENAESTA
jgi:hypothetical protein